MSDAGVTTLAHGDANGKSASRRAQLAPIRGVSGEPAAGNPAWPPPAGSPERTQGWQQTALSLVGTQMPSKASGGLP
ncbi:protein of unknown function (plasmid) [Methylocella tundrae]|uniref:Uncharacterized protein n=1 Tax=Methylocella tundrae TaxID=227605 RepID=A0A4U8Z8V2_METTU|nr:protein of unknown function [Methylocella tundrae]